MAAVALRLQAIIALGRIGDPRAIAALLPMFQHEDAFLTFSVRRALQRIGDWKAGGAGLVAQNPTVRAGMLLTLEGVYDIEAARRFRDRGGLTFPLLLDGDLAVSRSCDIAVSPTLLVLDGRERLRADAPEMAPERARRVREVIEGWSLDAYEACAEDIAARIGALPPDLRLAASGLPERRPG